MRQAQFSALPSLDLTQLLLTTATEDSAPLTRVLPILRNRKLAHAEVQSLVGDQHPRSFMLFPSVSTEVLYLSS